MDHRSARIERYSNNSNNNSSRWMRDIILPCCYTVVMLLLLVLVMVCISLASSRTAVTCFIGGVLLVLMLHPISRSADVGVHQCAVWAIVPHDGQTLKYDDTRMPAFPPLTITLALTLALILTSRYTIEQQALW